MLSLLLLTVLSFSFTTIKFNNYKWQYNLIILCMMIMISSTLIYSPCNSFFMSMSFICLDGLSSVLILLTCWISSMMLLASFMINLNNNFSSMFLFVVFFLNISLIISFGVSNIIWFYIFFELSLFPTLLLILGWGYQPERLQAGMYMVMYLIVASLPLLLLLMMSYYLVGYLSLFLLKISLVNSMSWLLNIQWLFLLLAFLIKTPIFSVHLWLPKAHVEAPAAGSMVLAGVLLKLGSYGMLRMVQLFNYSLSYMLLFILLFSLCGGVMSSFICLRQVDIKSLVAYASVGHMSLIVSGIMTNSLWGWQGSLIMMVAHGLCSSSLFALASFSYEKISSRSVFLMKGLLMLAPNMAMWWFLACIGNMAAPPTINLLSEIMLFMSTFFISSWMVIPLGLMTFMAAVYSLYLYSVTQHGGAPKFLYFFLPFKSQNFLLLFMHIVPMNMLIINSSFMVSWII
nr:NADH dehydrogenase subunit 4 [Acharax sp. NY-2022]